MEKQNSINDIAFDIGELALQSMLYEISCFPSLGLVSPISKGAHKDMDYFTFIKSTSVLGKYMIVFAQYGYSNEHPKEIFKNIREVGKKAEKDMFIKTKGINTHKGMIFLLGISCAAAAKAIHDNENFSYISEIIKKMTYGIVNNELKNIDKNKILTHGEELYLRYGMEGIRGQVEKGLPLIFDYSIRVYEENNILNENDRLVQTLISIMQFCDDTTILYRHSLEQLRYVQRKAKHIISIGGMNTKIGKKEIYDTDRIFSEKRISPGGSADLLATTVFFHLIKEKYF